MPFLVKDPEKVRDFLIGKLGFTFLQKTSITDGQECIIVGDPDASGCRLLLLKHTEAADGMSRIIVDTTDCLKAYHELISRGAIEVKKPQYTALGLTAEVTDGHGNNYTLLEERDYQEN